MVLANILGVALAALAAWVVLEQLLVRVLPLLERYLPDGICGPDAWLCDTANRSGIFDPRGRRNG